jgi:hypothetical protein
MGYERKNKEISSSPSGRAATCGQPGFQTAMSFVSLVRLRPSESIPANGNIDIYF